MNKQKRRDFERLIKMYNDMAQHQHKVLMAIRHVLEQPDRTFDQIAIISTEDIIDPNAEKYDLDK